MYVNWVFHAAVNKHALSLSGGKIWVSGSLISCLLRMTSCLLGFLDFLVKILEYLSTSNEIRWLFRCAKSKESEMYIGFLAVCVRKRA